MSWSVGGGWHTSTAGPSPQREEEERGGVLLLIHPSSEVVGARQFWGWNSPGPTLLQLGGIGVCLVEQPALRALRNLPIALLS